MKTMNTNRAALAGLAMAAVAISLWVVLGGDEPATDGTGDVLHPSDRVAALTVPTPASERVGPVIGVASASTVDTIAAEAGDDVEGPVALPRRSGGLRVHRVESGKGLSTAGGKVGGTVAPSGTRILQPGHDSRTGEPPPPELYNRPSPTPKGNLRPRPAPPPPKTTGG